MKTTLVVPDALFRKVKAVAASQGRSLKVFVNEALAEKLSGGRSQAGAQHKLMKYFGKVPKAEGRRIMKIVEEEFETIDPAEWK